MPNPDHAGDGDRDHRNRACAIPRGNDVDAERDEVGRTPAQDLDLVMGGGAVLVAAYLMERKVRRVWLRVGLDPTSVESLEAVLGGAPHRVFGTQIPTRGLFDRSAYTQIEGASRSGAWSIAVPTEDVDVLRYVLTRAEEAR